MPSPSPGDFKKSAGPVALPAPQLHLTNDKTLGLRQIITYALFFWATAACIHYGLKYVFQEIKPNIQRYEGFRLKPNTPVAKTDYYSKHAQDFDLIFIGDSKTFCALAPSEIDPILGTHSFNLSSWAHWFPTQFPNFQDLAPKIPTGTTVIWSIGHQNFRPPPEGVNLAYPIPWADMIEYLKWGYEWQSLRLNFINGLPGMNLYTNREMLRGRLENVFERPIMSVGKHEKTASLPASARGDAPADEPPVFRDSLKHQAELNDVQRQYAGDPGALFIEPLYEGNSITSVAIHRAEGNYYRIEFDHAFFRRKQREIAEKIRPIEGGRYAADPAYWKTFTAILDLFQQRGIHLVVNELSEAPFNYEIPENREALASFMDEVRDAVTKRGLPYLRVCTPQQLTDADYFDFNHLNSQGVEKFTRLFTAQVKPYLAK